MIEIFCSSGANQMNEDSKNYEMQILAMMINQYLDDMVSLSEEKLNQLEANCDQIVWDLATRIYKESGHKVQGNRMLIEFSNSEELGLKFDGQLRL
jgi:ElaB/YqjD/DUF883 family membrane-anchored ribosome-binding protein